ncbi:MAG: bifunctional alpha/beta hydrolase/OsmC family protein [Kiloniellales bacterium]|nr:bifunctional alpha/beta hydrolase/OsmC family protein [Kiloniellales bacterium]
MAVRSEKLTFTSASGESLAARLELPAVPPRAYALFAHCFTCTKDIFAASRIAGTLAEQGIAVLRFDFTGLGHSEGEFENTNFSSNVADLVAAAKFLAETREAPRILIGHSLGGAAVLAAAPQLPGLAAVATIGAPAEPAHVQHLFQEARPEIEARGEAEVLLAGRPFRIKKQFLEDIEGQKLEAAIASIRKPLIVFHSPRDDTVGIGNAAKIFMAAKHPKSFVSLDDADHLLTRRADAQYVATVLAAWAERYIGGAEASDLKAASGTVVVRETAEGRFTQEIRAGGHALRADEPESYGGLDTGPTPYDLLLAGLGACTGMTMRLYAERKKWPLERAQVTLQHEKIHATDCAECETKAGKLDRIERTISLEGPLDDEQRGKLLEIADKCPVHRTLHSEVIIRSRLS